MGNFWSRSQNSTILRSLLDENFPPVARFRLMSQGLSSAHCMQNCEQVVSNQACLACGNCVDACPQVLRKYGALTAANNRTSMHLENAVSDSCLRCYSCIVACPQVDRQLKNFAVRFRMAEKMVHWFLVAVYFAAAATGIGLHHFRAFWDPSFVNLIGIAHQIAAVGVLLSPVLLAIYDGSSFRGLLQKSFSWGQADIEWIKSAYRYATDKNTKSFYQGEYNTGQKYWYLLLLGAFFVLGSSGIVQWIGTGYFSASTVYAWKMVHIVYALLVDISLGIHILRKIIRTAKRWRQLYDENSLNLKKTQAGKA